MSIGPCKHVIVPAVLCALLGSGCESTSDHAFNTGPIQQERTDWQDGPAKGTRIRTDHFDIYTTMDDPQFVDFLPGYLESSYLFFASLLPQGDSNESGRMQTFILGNRLEWEKFVRKRFPSRYATYRRITAGGFSEGNTCVVYNIGRSATLSVLAHEGLHQYVAGAFSEPLPAWLNEGLATYCESVEFRKSVPHFTPQRNSFRTNHLRAACSAGDLISLRDLLATNAGKVIAGNKSTNTATYYAQAWSLVVFLQHGKGGKYAGGFRRMLKDIANGTIRIEAQAARVTAEKPSETSYGESVFLAYFTDDLERFEAELYQFIRKTCWGN